MPDVDVISFCPECLESWAYSWLHLYEDDAAAMMLEMALYEHLDAHRGTM